MRLFTSKAPLAALFFTIFLDMVGVGVLIPVIPLLFADTASPDYILGSGVPVSTGYLYIGALLALFSFGQFVAAPVIGELSDKYGRRRMLAFSIFGSFLGYVLFGSGILVKSVALIFIARLVNGITGGNIVVAQAAIADLSKPEDRAKNFGLIGAAFGLGFILGPFLGGKLADPSVSSWFSSVTPFWFAAGLSFLNMLLVLVFLPETNATVDPSKRFVWTKSFRNIRHALLLRHLRSLFTTNFLFQFGFTFYMTFASVYFFARFGWTEGELGNYFAYIGLWLVITQGLITRWASKWFTERQILKNSILLGSMSIMAIITIPSAFWLFFVAPFFAMAIGLTQANLTALLSRSAGAGEQGEILGINGSIQALAMAIPPLLSGGIAALFSPEAPLAISAVIVGFAGIYFIDRMRDVVSVKR